VIAQENTQSQFLVVVTGLSGAGRSVALNALEDMGFWCIDNLPMPLLSSTVSHFIANEPGYKNLAVGLDIRSDRFIESFLASSSAIGLTTKLELIYIDASDQVLAKRYSSARRPHPLHVEGRDLLECIKQERKVLEPIKGISNRQIDTSSLSPYELKRVLERCFELRTFQRKMEVSLLSFGFPLGLPPVVDGLFDVRCLKNPHYSEELRPLTGLDLRVGQYISQDSRSCGVIDSIAKFVEHSIPCYHEEGRHYLRLAIGCTGGRHRSVFVAEQLANLVRDNFGDITSVLVEHREI
jgi:RNase adapter protein RapZ